MKQEFRNVWSPEALDALRRQAENPSMWMRIKRRRRVSRPFAAWHLLRHGSVIYGCHFGGTVVIKATPRPLLMAHNFVECPDGSEHSP